MQKIYAVAEGAPGGAPSGCLLECPVDSLEVASLMEDSLKVDHLELDLMEQLMFKKLINCI